MSAFPSIDRVLFPSRLCKEFLPLLVQQIANINGVPRLAQQPGHGQTRSRAAYLQEAYGEKRMLALRLFHLRHNRPLPAGEHGGGLGIDSRNIH
jgi:hypothetical protein